MPRRWYYRVTVQDQDGKKTTYVGESADEIVQYIEDAELKPDTKPTVKARNLHDD